MFGTPVSPVCLRVCAALAALTQNGGMTASEPDAYKQMEQVEEALARLISLRRHPRYRQMLVAGTAFEGSVSTMRALRATDDLCRNGEQPSIRDLAERLGMEQSNASRVVEVAVSSGLLDKRQSEEDARRSVLKPTAAGKEAVRALNARRSEVHRDLTDGWRKSDLMSLADLLEKLGDSYEELER